MLQPQSRTHAPQIIAIAETISFRLRSLLEAVHALVRLTPEPQATLQHKGGRRLGLPASEDEREKSNPFGQPQINPRLPMISPKGFRQATTTVVATGATPCQPNISLPP